MKRGLSKRRSCKISGIARNTLSYKRKIKPDEARLCRDIHRLADLRKRYGYRRIHVLLHRNGWAHNEKRTYRIWREEGLQVPKKRRRRRRKGPKGEVAKRAQYRGHVWSYDFMQDSTVSGQKVKILNVIDEYTREWLSVRVARSITSEDVREVMEDLVAQHGPPMHIRSDNGPEFIAMAIVEWLEETGIETIFINPGSPWENPFVESFHDKVRDEHLNQEIFYTIKEAGILTEIFRRDYNENRPHSSLENATPAEMAAMSAGTSVSASLQRTPQRSETCRV